MRRVRKSTEAMVGLLWYSSLRDFFLLCSYRLTACLLFLLGILLPASADRPAESDDEAVVAVIDYDVTGQYGAGQNYTGRIQFAPIDLSRCDTTMLYLSFEAEIKERTKGDINVLSSTSGEVELSSSGTSNKNELGTSVHRVAWKPGIHTYRIPLVPSRRTGGDVDWSHINFLRIYMSRPSGYEGLLTVRISNVRILDLSLTTWLPNHFSDGMLVQQQKPIHVRGFSPAGRKITVRLNKGEETIDSQTTVSSDEGRWELHLAEHEGGYDTFQMEIVDGERVVQTIDDVVVGELWIASGQSNMALWVGMAAEAEQLLSHCTDPYLRVLNQYETPYPAGVALHPELDSHYSQWLKGDDPHGMNMVSAIGFATALQLRHQLDVPVGFVNAAVGSTRIENWLSFETMEGDERIVRALSKAGIWFTPETWTPQKKTSLAGCWNTKVAPLAGMPIAGVMWYQGESNYVFPSIYDLELEALVNSWERHFGFQSGTMPFVFCQVCPFYNAVKNPYQELLPLLDERMLTAWRASEQGRMAMLPLYDLPLTYGDEEIHPLQKVPVARRIAQSMMNLVYGGGEAYTAPVPENIEAVGDSLCVRFSHVGQGLRTTNGLSEVRGFSIAGNDGVFAPCCARIVAAGGEVADQVVLWNPDVKSPLHATYAYSTYHHASTLANSSGIPAAPFRSEALKAPTWFDQHVWIYCDSSACWALDSNYVARYVDTWTLNPITCRSYSHSSASPTITFTDAPRSEGFSSLCLTYPAEIDSVGVGPVLGYPSVCYPLAGLSSLRVDVMNPDEHPKEFALLVEDEQGHVITAPVSCKQSMVLEANSGFMSVVFDLTPLQENIPKANAIRQLQFTVIDSQGGTIYLDNILFGTSSCGVATSVKPLFRLPSDEDLNSRPVFMTPDGLPSRRGGLVFRKGKKYF